MCAEMFQNLKLWSSGNILVTVYFQIETDEFCPLLTQRWNTQLWKCRRHVNRRVTGRNEKTGQLLYSGTLVIQKKIFDLKMDFAFLSTNPNLDFESNESLGRVALVQKVVYFAKKSVII